MKRRKFLQWLGIGSAATVVVPLTLKELYKKYPDLKEDEKGYQEEINSPRHTPRGVDGRHAVRHRLSEPVTGIDKVSQEIKNSMIGAADAYCDIINAKRSNEGIFRLFDFGAQLGYAWEFKYV